MTLTRSILRPASRLALAACLSMGPVATWGFAAEPSIDAPQHVPTVGAFIVRVDGLEADAKFSWISAPEVQLADMLERKSGKPILFVSPTQAGDLHLVLAYSDAAGEIHQQVAVVRIGSGPTPPPDPEPDPPGPDPPPVTVGKRTLLIVRETADSTPAMARLVTSLRQPPHATYITSKGHSLAILDDDSVDENGQPTPRLEAWRPHFQGMTLPALFVIDATTNAIVHKQSIPADTTADSLMAIVKAHGG